MFKPALLFQTGMTLQRGKRVPIWGTAEPYAEVTATIQSKTACTRAGADGRWRLEVGPLSVSFAETLTLRSGAACLEYTDVQVGDVWLAAGQSNMEFYMEYDADSAEETPACIDDALRFFDYPKVAYPGQLAEADYLAQHGRWRKAAPDQLRWFSAVGYYFAKEIRARYGVPVAIVGCNWSGTPACTWMSEESLMEGGGRIYLDEYRAALETLDRDAYEAEFRANPANWRIAPLDDEGYDAMMRGDFEPTDPNTPLEPIPVPGPKSEKRPGALYESMLCCVAPYALRGILYYQGESDGDRYNQLYETLFPALIRGYRRLWGEDLPFLFVQLAPFGRWQNCDGTRYALIRQAQQHAADTVPGTGMAVITDVGMQHDIADAALCQCGRRAVSGRLPAHRHAGRPAPPGRPDADAGRRAGRYRRPHGRSGRRHGHAARGRAAQGQGHGRARPRRMVLHQPVQQRCPARPSGAGHGRIKSGGTQNETTDHRPRPVLFP